MYTELQEVWQELTTQGAPFHVEEIEVRGSPMRVYSAAPPSLRELWLASTVHASNDYLVYNEERWTYEQAHRDVASIANWLRNQGINPGDRVAISMRNYPEWLLAYWACVSTGVAAVGLNAWWIDDELEYGLKDSAPKVLICDQERLDRFDNIKNNFTDMVIVGVRISNSREYVIPFADLIATGGALPEVTIDPDAEGCMFYTSGTTGKPKGAQLTHRGCVHNVMNLGFW